MKRISPDRLAIAALTIAVLVVFFDVLFLGNGLVRGDLFRYHYPMKKIVRDTLLAGELPWWNRHYASGQPMAANPAYEVFYPGQWPILIGSYRFGFNLHIVLHVWLSGLGMYLLLRALPTQIVPAFAGAVSFSFGGFFIGALSTLPACFVWAWTPLLLYALLRFARERQRRHFILAAVVLAMQFLVGEPVSLLLNLILGASLVTWELLNLPATDRRVFATYASFAAVVAAGLGLAAVQIIPAVDHLGDTARAEGLTFGSVMQFSTPPGRLVELFFPFIYGHHADSGSFFWGLASHGRAPYFASIYLGVLTAVSLLASIFVIRRLAIAAIVFSSPFYVVALGEHTPVFAALYDLGLVAWFRYPGKILAIAIIPLIVVGTITFDRFLSGERRARAAVIGAASTLTLVSGLLAIFSLTPNYARWFLNHWELRGSPRSAALLEISQRDFRDAFVVYAALAIVLIFATRIHRVVWISVLALVVAADLARVGSDVTLKMPPRFFETPGIAAALGDARRDYTIFHAGDWYSETTLDGFSRMGDQFYWVERNGLIPPTQGAWGLRGALERDYDETYLAPTRQMIAAMVFANRRVFPSERWWHPFAAMANVRYLIGYRDFEAVVREVRGDFSQSRPVAVRRGRIAYPRYFFATELVRADDWRTAATEALDRDLDAARAFIPGPTFVPAPGRVIVVRETPSAATIEVESEGRAFLVMTVTRHRYWNVTIDGRPAPVIPANIAYQGVVVPRGRHTVVMRYRNRLVFAGGAVSVGTAILLALTASGTMKWKRPAI